MKLFRSILILIAAAALCWTTAAQQQGPGLKTIAISKVKLTPAVLDASGGKKNSLGRMAQALDGQLIDSIQNTRKFQVIARSDADALIEEAGSAGRSFDFGNADYLLVPSINDFQDLSETASFASLGMAAKRRIIRFSVMAVIYDAKTNKVVETANFQEKSLDSEEIDSSVSSDGELSDSLLIALTRRMAGKIALRVTDIAYPARIVGKTGKIITINRGEGTGISVGQEWEVFALGKEMIDPDTGVSLGREELAVGKVRVTRVTPMTSQAQIVGEDLGIERGAVLRMVETAEQ